LHFILCKGDWVDDLILFRFCIPLADGFMPLDNAPVSPSSMEFGDGEFSLKWRVVCPLLDYAIKNGKMLAVRYILGRTHRKNAGEILRLVKIAIENRNATNEDITRDLLAVETVGSDGKSAKRSTTPSTKVSWTRQESKESPLACNSAPLPPSLGSI
jgi:hypothetical protein